MTMTCCHRMLRDLFTEDIERLIIDEESAYKKALEFLNSMNPRLKSRVELYRGAFLCSIITA